MVKTVLSCLNAVGYSKNNQKSEMEEDVTITLSLIGEYRIHILIASQGAQRGSHIIQTLISTYCCLIT